MPGNESFVSFQVSLAEKFMYILHNKIVRLREDHKLTDAWDQHWFECEMF